MPVAAAIVGSAIVGGVVASKSASKAAAAQTAAADAAAAEQRAAREELRTLLQPYTAAGTPALQAQMNLLGLGQTTTDWNAYAQSNPQLMAAYQAQQGQGVTGTATPYGGLFGNINIQGQTPQTLEQFAQNYYQTQGQGADISQFQTTGAQAQQNAINAIEQGPMFQALAQQGENAILQNASATGGLRGGNTQGALAQFRPQLLNQQIQQQYQNLAGMTALGQQSAAGVGSGGIQTATNIGNAYTQAGQAQAGGYLASGQAINNAIGQIGGFAASGGFGGIGSSLPTASAINASALSSLRGF